MKRIVSITIVVLLILSNVWSVNAQSLKNALASPGNSASDWSAIALLVSGEDFDKDLYMDGLREYVKGKYLTESKLSPSKATEWHRIIIAVTLLGENAENFEGINLLNDGVFFRKNLGRQGLNAYIWALIAVSSGGYNEPSGAINTIDGIVNHILSKQNTDGSFSLKSNAPDCDITAMAIYALSDYREREDVGHAINNALNFLDSVQNADGSFSANSIPNSETTAQVITALSSIGCDVKTDARFVGLYDALLAFKTADGFMHTYGGATDTIATYQGVCAIAAANKMSAVYKGEITFEEQKEVPTEAETQIIKDDKVTLKAEVQEEETTMPATSEELATDCTEAITEAPSEDNIDEKQQKHLKLYIFLSVLFVIITFYGIMVKKPLVIVTSLLLLSLCFIGNSESAKDITVYVSINCNSINNNYDKLDNSLKNSRYIPDDGIILSETAVTVKEGDSVLDLIKKACSEKDIQLEYSQSPNDSYVQGINYIYEFSCGDLSGWMYSVNGEFAHVGCSDYPLKNDDYVVWQYTCDLGKDLVEVTK